MDFHSHHLRATEAIGYLAKSPLVPMILVITMVLCFGSCRSEIKTKIVKADAPSEPANSTPAPPPVISELSGSLRNNQEYFQTRSVVELEYSNELIQQGGTWSLINTTTNKTLFEGQSFSLNFTDQGYLTQDYEYLFMAYGKVSQRQISLFLWTSDPSPPLAYGENELLFKSVNSESIKQEKKKLYLKDFNIFEVSTASFSSQIQREGGLQGQVGVFSNQVSVTNGVRYLDTGLIPITNL